MTSTPPLSLPLQLLLQQALAHHRGGRLPEAKQLYQRVLQSLPAQADANYNLGVLIRESGLITKSLPYLKAALDALPSREQYWQSYAEALLAGGQAKMAQSLLHQAVQRGFKGPEIHALRNKAKAVARYKPLKGSSPSPLDLQQLSALFNAGHHEEVEIRARLLLEHHPESGFLWKALGVALESQGKDALHAQQKAVDLLPDDAESLRNLYFTLAARGSDYPEWMRRYDTLTEKSRLIVRSRIAAFRHQPLISVVMPVYDPPLHFLEDAIRSVQNQLYPNWELCIADDASTNAAVQSFLQRYADNDARIKVVFRKTNGHISAASNSALELVSGEYIALLDNDDLLAEHALFWLADAILAHPSAGLIYSDEDKIDEAGRRYDPYFKSDWNPDLFHSHNMISHLGAYRTDLVRKLGGFREGYEGSQDYDLALRCTERLAPAEIVHIPRVLYHWRSHSGSTALSSDAKPYALLAAERALNNHFFRIEVSAKAELLNFGMYRVRYSLPSSSPLVSLIIPTRNSLHLIKPCVESILDKTTYKNFEILIVDNNSNEASTLDYFASLANEPRIRILRDERPFNYSALNNAAVQQARGDYIGLINNDIVVINPDWLEEMLGLATQPAVGAVGARLWYPNDTLQHGGVITGIWGVAGHVHPFINRGASGYFGRAQLIQTFSAVTAACLVIKKSIYQSVGGLEETHLKVIFNDVDFCLRVREAGYRNVWTPYAELYHYESATRGKEDTPEKKLRAESEIRYLQKRWGETLINDPAYSPNLTLDRADFSYAWPPRVEIL
jgi:glycosyltransferase involved in cell wall biosynthesis